MKAAIMRAVNAPLSIEDVVIGTPSAREVLVDVKASGVCHSDVHFWTGDLSHPLPVIPGHECAGVVSAVGDMVTDFAVGDHVVGVFAPFCGNCNLCHSGHLSLCHTKNAAYFNRPKGAPPRLSVGGEALPQLLNMSSFAEQILVHENALCKITPDMPLDLACLLGCAVVTGVGAVMHATQVQAGSTVAVIGCGGVGLSTINGAAIAGAGRIIAVDINAEKLALAKEFGATDIINAAETDPVKAVKDITKGGVEYSFEAIGLKQTCEQAVKMCRPRGVATLLGMPPLGVNLELHGIEIVYAEKRLQGALVGSSKFRMDIPLLVDWYLDGRLKLDKLVSSRIKLEDATAALQNLRENTGGVARQVIVFD